jgi:hypothetical protein
MNRGQLDELLLQAPETERGGVSVYETASSALSTTTCGRSGRSISSRRSTTSGW